MFKKLVITILVVGVLLVGVAIVSAQGPRGNRDGNCDRVPLFDCMNNRDDMPNQGMMNQNRMNRNGRNQQGFSMRNSMQNLPDAVVSELPQDVIDLMVRGWMDEQNAHAIYTDVIDEFGNVRPFVNIRNAEVQHAEVWEYLFDRYNIDIPDVPDFDDVEFDTVAEACQAGYDAEVMNFELYDEMLETFEAYPDLYIVAQNLRDASELHHLPAFERCAQ